MGGSQDARRPTVCRAVLHKHITLIPAYLLKYPEKKKNLPWVDHIPFTMFNSAIPLNLLANVSCLVQSDFSRTLVTFLVYSWWSIYRFYVTQLSHCVNFLETVYVNDYVHDSHIRIIRKYYKIVATEKNTMDLRIENHFFRLIYLDFSH